MRDSAVHADEGERAQEQVPVREGHLQIEGLTVLHVPLPKVAEGQVEGDQDHRDGGVVPREVHAGKSIVVLLEGSVEVRQDRVVLEELGELLTATVDVRNHGRHGWTRKK